MKTIYSIGEVSRMLDIQAHRIAYAIITRALPEAPFRFTNKRCFTSEDVERIALYFGLDVPTLDGEQQGGE